MKIAINSIIYMVSTGITRGMPFLLLPILTRYLSIDSYGKLSIALVIVSAFSIVIGMNPSLFVITKYFRYGKKEMEEYSFQIILISICMAILAFFIMYFGSKKIVTLDLSVQLSLIITIIAFNKVLINLRLTYLQMENRSLKYLYLNLLYAVPIFILITFFIVVLGSSWENVLIAEALVGCFLMILIVIPKFSLGDLANLVSKGKIIKFIKFSLPMIPHAMAFWVISSIDRIFLAQMIDIKVAGLYSTAATLGLGLSLVHESVHRASQPFFFESLEKGGEKEKRNLIRFVWSYYLGSIIFLIMYYIFLKLILPLFLSKEFQVSLEYTPILLIGYTFLGMYRVVSGFILFGNRTILLAIITTISAILNILLNYFLISLNGAVGAAQATLFSFLFLFAVVQILAILQTDISFFNFNLFRKRY